MKFEELEKFGSYFRDSSGDSIKNYSEWDELEGVYEPIKMTKKQKEAINVNFFDLFEIIYDNDWETGSIDEDSLQIEFMGNLFGLSEIDIVRAWLYPDCIEVVE